jgi:ABC-type multidrug transport system fused ATPase/permease subunit
MTEQEAMAGLGTESTPAQRVRRWFYLLWKDSPIMLALILVLSIFNMATVIAFPWLWQYLIDGIQMDSEGPSIEQVATWMLIIAVVQTLLYSALQVARTIMNAKVQLRARRMCMARLTELVPAAFSASRSGDMVTRLSDDAGEKLSWFMCSGIFRCFEASLVVLGSMVLMVTIDPWLSLWVILPLPFLLAAQAFVQGALGRRFMAVQRSISDINDQLTTRFSGIRVLRANCLEPQAEADFEARIAVQRDAEIRCTRLQQLVFMMYGHGWQLAMVALVFAGGLRVMEGAISLGELVAFEGFTMALVWPMFDVGMFLSKYKQAAVALERLEALWVAPSWPAAEGNIEPVGSTLEAVSLGVEGEEGVRLVPLDFRLEEGRRLAVVGEVGSGKSTLLAALARLLPEKQSALWIGGHPMSSVSREWLNTQVAYVPQDPQLLSTTIRENILLGRAFSDEALARALHLSRLEADLAGFPEGLDTAVGERGLTLSGGQQQRVALARALVGRPRILLLDAPTAALDADTETAFWKALEAEEHTPSTVVVTHRVATIESADEVLVLEKGRLVQRGRHASLLAEGGTYARIYGRYQAMAQLEV